MRSAVIDACALYSAFLRDLTMRLAVAFVFQPKWTEQIHDEWMRNVLLNRPDLQREQLERTRELMDQFGRDCLVEGFEPLIDTLSLPDKDDRHVFAAAIHSKTPVIVTFNLSDFPISVLKHCGVEALHPDAFFSQLFSENSALFLSAAQAHRVALKRPPHTASEYIESLQRNRLNDLAGHLALFLERI